MGQLPNAVAGLPDQDSPNTNGKSRGQLNPAWVEQLMGLPYNWVNLFTGDFYYEEKLSTKTSTEGSKSGKVSQLRSDREPAKASRGLQETSRSGDTLPDLPQESSCSQQFLGCTKKAEGMCCVQYDILSRSQPSEDVQQELLSNPCKGICSKKMGLKWRVDMLRLLGNGVVRQCAAKAWIELWNKIHGRTA